MMAVFDLAPGSCLKNGTYKPDAPPALPLIPPAPALLLHTSTPAEMNLLSVAVVLLSLAGLRAQLNMLRPLCDSPEVEEAALVAQDYLNNQHTHGYKYALNRIEDVKVFTVPDGNNTYVLEVDLLETDCHVRDPTPVANCTVRPKILTAVEGDCDVVLKRVAGVLTVTAFKCKTEESTEDLCLGCPALLPLNDTRALNFVHASLATFNRRVENVTFSLLEVGRMLSQVVSGGPNYIAEYVVVEANCTGGACEPLQDATAAHGFCSARGLDEDHKVDCKMFPALAPAAGSPAAPAVVHVHAGLKHHKLTTIHNPHLSDLLSSESTESAEVVAVAPAVVPPVLTIDSVSDASDCSASVEVPVAVVKREAPVAPSPSPLVPVCPGRIRFF